MNKYRIFSRVRGTDEVEAATPQEAVEKLFPDSKVVPMKCPLYGPTGAPAGKLPDVQVELINGRRRSRSFFGIYKKTPKPLTDQEVAVEVMHLVTRTKGNFNLELSTWAEKNAFIISNGSREYRITVTEEKA